jgi:hypothetical protein
MSKSDSNDSNEMSPASPPPPPSSRFEVDSGTGLPARLVHHTRPGTAPGVTPSRAAPARVALTEIERLIGELSSGDQSNLFRDFAGLPSIKVPGGPPDGPGLKNIKQLIDRLSPEDKAALLQWFRRFAENKGF